MRGNPHWLKPSALVDLRLTILGIRPAFRTETSSSATNAEIGRWARARSLYFCRDADDFIVFSTKPWLVRHIMTVDQSPGDHLARLGYWLGYPPCCIRSARRMRESNLDRWSEALGARRHIGRFTSNRVSGYRAGQSLISHIPCSPQCKASLDMATKIKNQCARPARPQGSL